MERIRFSSTPGLQSMAQALPAPIGQAALSQRTANPLLTTGKVGQLLHQAPASTAPNVYSAANLLQVQAHTASLFTDPSSTPAEPHSPFDVQTGFRGATTANAVLKGLTRATSRLGSQSRSVGSVAGVVGAAAALPSGVANAVKSIEKAMQTGDRSDVAQAAGNSSSAGSVATRLAKHSLETYSLGSRVLAGHLARTAGSKAFRQVAPAASKAVVKAAARQAAKEAAKASAAKAAGRAVAATATSAAKSASTLARGAGGVSRGAAKALLKEGGEAAAKAAGKAVARGALKSGAKAAGRFVPGLNVAIAGLDTATAAATLADPKASTGKKVTSVITAAGSIVAATNIPVVSQVGAAVSTVSSFIGSFF